MTEIPEFTGTGYTDEGSTSLKAMLTKGCRMEADTPLRVLCDGIPAKGGTSCGGVVADSRD